jgi:hypothetical protein
LEGESTPMNIENSRKKKKVENDDSITENKILEGESTSMNIEPISSLRVHGHYFDPTSSTIWNNISSECPYACPEPLQRQTLVDNTHDQALPYGHYSDATSSTIWNNISSECPYACPEPLQRQSLVDNTHDQALPYGHYSDATSSTIIWNNISPECPYPCLEPLQSQSLADNTHDQALPYGHYFDATYSTIWNNISPECPYSCPEPLQRQSLADNTHDQALPYPDMELMRYMNPMDASKRTDYTCPGPLDQHQSSAYYNGGLTTNQALPNFGIVSQLETWDLQGATQSCSSELPTENNIQPLEAPRNYGNSGTLEDIVSGCFRRDDGTQD